MNTESAGDIVDELGLIEDATRFAHMAPKLIDELGDIRRQLLELAPLQRRAKELSELLRTQLGQGVFEGIDYIAVISPEKTGRLDTKAIRAEMSRDWLSRYTKEPGLTIRIMKSSIKRTVASHMRGE
jgi:hypothetical protein